MTPERGTPSAHVTANAAGIVVRRFMTGDPIPAITSLLHRAYARQQEMGLDPLAGRQDDARTLDRILNSESYVALQDPEETRVVGVILLNEHEQVRFPPYFLKRGVSHFAMFAVDPDAQAAGIGRLLLTHCEERSRELGSTHLALSMAEPDEPLFRYYERRGYAFVEHWQWPYTNYRSVILSKALG